MPWGWGEQTPGILNESPTSSPLPYPFRASAAAAGPLCSFVNKLQGPRDGDVETVGSRDVSSPLALPQMRRGSEV